MSEWIEMAMNEIICVLDKAHVNDPDELIEARKHVKAYLIKNIKDITHRRNQ
jgi:hypothetical protein